MDLVDLIIEKRFVGQEFLTWLWWKSEERGGSVEIPDIGDIIIVFEKHMLLEFGEAEYSEKMVCSGLQTELREARTGLRTGKKLEQARLHIVKGDYEWNVTLGATIFEYRSVRPPKTTASVPDHQASPEETEGMILERIFLFEELVRIVDDLFRLYLRARLGNDWQQQLQLMRRWVEQAAAKV
ncbi:MAG: hypothetical protein IH612_01625 [Desulfofustis sp.]|nr:hypothetical protein [Desulfofustis sp.]